MRGFSKAGKIFCSILLVMIIASLVMLVMSLTGKDQGAPDIKLTAIACVGSVLGFIMTYRTAVKERDAKLKVDEEDEGLEESYDDDDSEISDY